MIQRIKKGLLKKEGKEKEKKDFFKFAIDFLTFSDYNNRRFRKLNIKGAGENEKNL